MKTTCSFGRQAIAWAMLAFSTALSADSFTWTNQAGGSWNQAGNWDKNRVPEGTDSVTIPSGVAVVITDVAAIGGLALNTGSSLTIAAGATLDLVGDAGRSFSGPITNRGTINWQGGPIAVYGTMGGHAGEIWNEAGALFDIQCDQPLSSAWESPSAPLHNAGTLRKSAGSGTTDISLMLENTGILVERWCLECPSPAVPTGCSKGHWATCEPGSAERVGSA